jgi:hypothetical protein
MKEKFINDMAKAISLAKPAFAKKKIVLASLKPKPPRDIGNKVIAPIMGRKTKK